MIGETGPGNGTGNGNGAGDISWDVFQAFDLQPEKIVKTNRIYKVSGNRGVFALKQIESNRKKLYFIHSVIQHLRAKGLSAVVPYELTVAGEPLFIKDDFGYLLSRWIEGRQLDFSSSEDLLRAVNLMAELHVKGEGYAVTTGNWQRNRLGSWLSLWVSERKELCQCPFFGSMLKDLLNQADEALRLLNLRGTYQQEVELATRAGTVCHRDLVYHNFLLDNFENLHIIDFEYCALELPVADLGRFLRKALPQHDWNWDIVQQLLNSYQAIYPLSPGGMQLLRAYLTFPHEWWRMARRLMSGTLTKAEIAKRVDLMNKKDRGRKKLLQELAATW